MDEILGIDIGGSGIKGAPVNITTGNFTQERFRIPTPVPSKPELVASVVAEIAKHFNWNGSIGCGFPAVIRHGVAYTAANVHRSWIGTHAENIFSKVCQCPVTVINDADAAGLAEQVFGVGKNYPKGVVLMLTIGTGIGSAIFVDGILIPNTEFGHLQVRGKDAEIRASDATRQRKKMAWDEWAERLNEYLQMMESLIWPDVIVLGGGVSKDFNRFAPFLNVRADVVPAQLLNNAGIVGAALAATRYGAGK